MDNSIGCLTRYYIGEMPYLKSFVRHYLDIGVSHFYFVVNQKDDVDRLLLQMQEFGDCYTVIVEEEGRNVNRGLKIDISQVKTKYLISIDIDEFLYCDKGKPLKALLSPKVPGYRMRWVMSPCDFGDISVRPGFYGHASKQLALVDKIDGISSPHAFSYREPTKCKKMDSAQLVHYWGRSFEDIVIKCIYQRLPNSKRTSLQEMQDLLAEGKLPNRLRLLASLVRHEASVKVPVSKFDIVDRQLENELLAVADKAFLDELKRVYIDYRDKLDYKKHVGIYPEVGSIFDLEAALP